MENNSTAAPNAQQPTPQPPLGFYGSDPVWNFIQETDSAMGQIKALFDVVVESKHHALDVDIAALACTGWEIANGISGKVAIVSPIAVDTFKMAQQKGGVSINASAGVAIPRCPNNNEHITVNKRELTDTLNALNNASEIFDQLDSLLRVINRESEDHEVQNLAKLAREIATMQSGICSCAFEDFEREYDLNKLGGL